MDHSGWPTLNAAMNKSPHMAIIAIVSNWMKGLLDSGLIEESSPVTVLVLWRGSAWPDQASADGQHELLPSLESGIGLNAVLTAGLCHGAELRSLGPS